MPSRRPLEPYLSILEEFLSGQIDALGFRTRTIQQYDKADARVDWSREWNDEVANALDQMDGDAEVYYPEAPQESYITLEELRESSQRNLQRLKAAITSASGVCRFPIDPNRPIPRGTDISYECLKCGDVIPSVETSARSWNCRCNNVSVDHAAFKAWFGDPKSVRGVRVAAPPLRPSSEQGVAGGSPERADGPTTNHFSCSLSESFVVLAAVGFAIGMGGSGIARLIEGHYGLGLTLLAIALLPFGAWAVVRWIVLRRAAKSARSG